jgi:hypothetical protein
MPCRASSPRYRALLPPLALGKGLLREGSGTAQMCTTRRVRAEGLVVVNLHVRLHKIQMQGV